MYSTTIISLLVGTTTVLALPVPSHLRVPRDVASGTSSAEGARGSQFITGECGSNNDCVSGCCVAATGLCGAVGAQTNGAADCQGGTALPDLLTGAAPAVADTSAAPAVVEPPTDTSSAEGPRGSQFITGECGSNNDCVSGCCVAATGLCGAVGAQTNGAADCQGGVSLPDLFNGGAAPAPEAAPAVVAPPTDTSSAEGARGSQFITGECGSNNDCVSGCCVAATGLCGAVGAQTNGAADCQGGTALPDLFNGGAAPAPEAAPAVAPPSDGTATSSADGARGSQFITGECSSNNDCVSGCCVAATGLCGAVGAQTNGAADCQGGVALPNLAARAETTRSKKRAAKRAADAATQAANAADAQALNAKFQSLAAGAACTDGETLCVQGAVSQCVGGQVTQGTQCAGGLQCVAVPLVNSRGTSVICDTEEDALSRIQLAGGSASLTGSGASSSSGSASSGQAPPAAAAPPTDTSSAEGPRGSQFITGECGSNNDCVSGCCVAATGLCGAVGAQTNGAADCQGGVSLPDLFNGGAAMGTSAAPPVAAPPTDTSSAEGARGSQFITGECGSNNDCVSGCCVAATGLCGAVGAQTNGAADCQGGVALPDLFSPARAFF